MIRVLFDNTEVHGDYIMNLTQSVEPYNQNFIIGNTICREFSIDVNNDGFTSIPDKVYLYEDNDSDVQSNWTKYATLLVDDTENENENYTTFYLTDVMVRFNKDLVYTTGSTLLAILNSICSNHGINLITTSFYMSGFKITWTDDLSERDLISYIAEVNGGYAYINADGNLVITQYSNTPADSININECSSFKLGALHQIDRVYLELASATKYYPSSSSNDTLYLNPANILYNDAQGFTIDGILQHIYGIVNGLTFYNIEIEQCPINPDIRAGEMLRVGENNEWYQFICTIDYNYSSKWLGGYETDLECKVQEETKIITSNELITRINIKVDRELGEISQSVSDLEATTTASLALKVDKTDNNQVISMINAAADNIVLNTKSLIFGVYPSGQYIEVKNYKASSSAAATGVTFDGTGSIFMRPQGKFIVNNLIAGDTSNYHNRFVMDNAATGTSNSTYISNYDDSSNLLVNYIQLLSHYTASNQDSNRIWIWNYASDTGSNSRSNFIEMYGRSDRNYFDLVNYYPTSNQIQNRIIFDSDIVSGNEYSNRLMIHNYKTSVNQFANRIVFYVPTTVSSSTAQYLEMLNYNSSANSIGNRMRLESYPSENTLTINNNLFGSTNQANRIIMRSTETTGYMQIENGYYNSSNSQNKIILTGTPPSTTSSSAYNSIFLYNNFVSSSNVGNLISLNTSRSSADFHVENKNSGGSSANYFEMISGTTIDSTTGNKISLENYSTSGVLTNYIRMDTKNMTYIWSSSDLKLYSDGAVRIKSGGTQDVQVIAADDLDLQAGENFYISIAGTLKEVYFSGNYLMIRNRT